MMPSWLDSVMESIYNLNIQLLNILWHYDTLTAYH